MGNRLMLTHSIGESLLHIHLPVAQQAVKHVIDRLGYHDVFQDNIDISTDFFDWSKTKDKEGRAAIRDDRVRVKLNPNVNPSTNKWEGSGTTTALANGNLVDRNGAAVEQRLPWAHGSLLPNRKFSVFRDNYIDVDMHDITVGCSMTMEITLEFHDEFRANEALSRIFQCFTHGDMTNYIDIMYDFPVPSQLQSVLRYLYHLKMQSKDNPNGAFDVDEHNHKHFKHEEWYEWLKKYSNDAITTLSNRNKFGNLKLEHRELVVNKNHFQALYQIDCSQETPSKMDPRGASITFNLVIQFARSNILALEYPIVVNNQYIDTKFVPLERVIRAAGPETAIMWQNPAVTKLWQDTYTQFWPPKPFVYPFYDPWMTPRDDRASLWGYKPVIICTFTLDNVDDPEGVTTFDFDTDPQKVFESYIDEQILNCIHEKKNAVFGVSEFVNITVFADDVAVDPKYLDISDGHTLTVKCKNTQRVYRMVVGLHPPVKNRIMEWNKVWIVCIHTKKRKD